MAVNVKQAMQENKAAMEADEAVTLLDKLKSKRTELIKLHNAKLRELNRMITTVESVDPETVVREAQEVLNS